MNISNETTIGEIVAQDYRAASVFQKNGIDFCCNGNKFLNEVCESKNIDVNTLLTEINEALTNGAGVSIDYNSWPIDLLADFVEKKHHRYVEAKIPEILPYLEKIVSVHGVRHSELSKVLELFKTSAGELSKHMKKEEIMLFPKIRKLVNATDNSGQVNFSSIADSIRLMMDEHDDEGRRFDEIAELTNNYTPPADGCNTYKVTLAMLKEFEEDLHLHIHLENNILFPKSIKKANSLVNA